jgi:hypothetical protein
MKPLLLGACIGLAIGMALGWFPHRLPHPSGNEWDANQGQNWIAPEDRAKAKEVEDDGCDDEDYARILPPGAKLLQCGSVTIAAHAKPKGRRRG